MFKKDDLVRITKDRDDIGIPLKGHLGTYLEDTGADQDGCRHLITVDPDGDEWYFDDGEFEIAFKKGDHVRINCEDDSIDEEVLHKVGIYEFRSVIGHNIKMEISGKSWYFDATQFDLVPPEYVFKAGDTVRITTDRYDHKGRIGLYEEDDGTGESQHKIRYKDDGDYNFYNDGDFELIEEASPDAPTPDAPTPDIFPVDTKVDVRSRSAVILRTPDEDGDYLIKYDDQDSHDYVHKRYVTLLEAAPPPKPPHAYTWDEIPEEFRTPNSNAFGSKLYRALKNGFEVPIRHAFGIVNLGLEVTKREDMTKPLSCAILSMYLDTLKDLEPQLEAFEDQA